MKLRKHENPDYIQSIRAFKEKKMQVKEQITPAYAIVSGKIMTIEELLKTNLI